MIVRKYLVCANIRTIDGRSERAVYGRYRTKSWFKYDVLDIVKNWKKSLDLSDDEVVIVYSITRH